MTGYEQKFYSVVPSALASIAESLKTLTSGRTIPVEPKGNGIASGNAPYWDDERKAVFIPIINKFLDAKNLSPNEETWDDAMRLAKEAGKALPSLNEIYILLYYKEGINAVLKEHGGDVLDDWYWSSSESWPTYAWSVYFNGGNIYGDAKCGDNYVRAVAAL